MYKAVIVLFVWVPWSLLTLAILFFTWRIGRKAGLQRWKIVLCLGISFMVTMGWAFIPWRMEYVALRDRMDYLCSKESRFTVYITPEEWRKQIGEDEWQEMNLIEGSYDEEHTLIFEGIEYHHNYRLNKRVVILKGEGIKEKFIYKTYYIAYDTVLNEILYQSINFSLTFSHYKQDISGKPRFWLKKNIKRCSFFDLPKDKKFIKYRYVNNKVINYE